MVPVNNEAIGRLTLLSFFCLMITSIACEQPTAVSSADGPYNQLAESKDSQDSLRFDILDLGSIEGRSFHEARAVNNSGQIAGVSKTMTPPALQSFFLWDEQQEIVDLGRPDESLSGTLLPHAINSGGYIAGENYPYAVLWSPSDGFRTLDEGVALGLNDAGVSVGYSSRPFDPDNLPHEGTRAVLWREDGSNLKLETFSEKLEQPVERDWNQAHDINNHREVAGFSVYPAGSLSGPRRAVIWEDGKITRDLGTLGGSSEAYAINDHGQVVGQSEIESVPDGQAYVFSWDDSHGLTIQRERVGRDQIRMAGKPGFSFDGAGSAVENSSVRPAQSDLPDGHSSQAQDSSDKTVHSFETSRSGNEHLGKFVMANTERAFIWDDMNGMVSLGTHGEGPSVATDINNHGQVVGYILIPATETETNRARGFYWDEDQGMILLEPLDENLPFSFAFGINDDGIIVGRSSSEQPGEMRAVRWKMTRDKSDPAPEVVHAESD